MSVALMIHFIFQEGKMISFDDESPAKKMFHGDGGCSPAAGRDFIRWPGVFLFEAEGG